MNTNKIIAKAAFAARIRIGSSGPEITCDTLNGDILIKKSH
jgi:hypothetical protein